MRRLKVAWITHFLPYPPKGGVLQRGYGLLTGLSRYVDIHLLAMIQPRLMAQTFMSGDSGIRKACTELEEFVASIQTADIPAEAWYMPRYATALLALFAGRSYTEQWLRSRRLAADVPRWIDRISPDLVYLDTISLLYYAAHLPRDLPVVLGHHNVESHMMRRRARRTASRLARLYYREESRRILALERRAAKGVDAQVVCSTLDRRRLMRLTGAADVIVAENGVASQSPAQDGDHLGRTAPGDPPRLLFIGRMSAYTNKDAAQYLAQEIWPAIREKIPGARLDVVGSSPPAQLVDLAACDPAVHVWGFVDNLADVIRADMIFVCPVRDGGGTKLKILDAMNAGQAVVAHPVALEGIPGRDGVHFLVARTPSEFADAVRRLAEDSALRTAIAESAAALVTEYLTFDAIALRLHEHLQRIAMSRRNFGLE